LCVSTKPKVLVFGSISVDNIWELSRIPRDHEKIDAKAMYTVVGGSGANTASWLSNFGHDVTLIGAVGDDVDSKWIISELESQKIKAKSIKRIKGKTANHAISLISGSTKRIIRQRNIDMKNISWGISELKTLINKVDHVHISSIESKTSEDISNIARSLNKSISIELNGRKMSAQRKNADVLFCNSIELKTIFNISISKLSSAGLAKMIPGFNGNLVVTNGANSVVAVTPHFKITEKVKKWGKIKDRTGAGDSFDAGFLSSWLTNSPENVSKAIKVGMATSASCVMNFGGQAK
jgi:sugar/nucleoside kinase (ribokinase family)